MDSLKFNLKGKTEPFTNWNFSVDYDPDFFDETLFSQIDYALLKPTELPDTTSFISPIVPIDSLQNESVKNHSEISPDDYKPTTDNNNLLSENISFLLLVFASLFIVGLVRFSRKEFFNNIFIQFFQQGRYKADTSDTISNRYPSLILKFIFFFNCSLFVFELITLTDFEFFQIGSFAIPIDLLAIPIVFAALLIIFSLKNIVFYFIGYIFDTVPQIKLYIKNSYLISSFYAIIILPIIITIPFLQSSVQLFVLHFGVYIFIVLYIIMIWKGIKIIVKETYSFYYIILYLCAMEILPLLVIIKMIS